MAKTDKLSSHSDGKETENTPRVYSQQKSKKKDSRNQMEAMKNKNLVCLPRNRQKRTSERSQVSHFLPLGSKNDKKKNPTKINPLNTKEKKNSRL